MPQEFQIQFHEAERILEVRYPAKPTLESYQRYETAVRAAIEAIGGGWKCLVDQSDLTVMPPELPPLVATLNAWALQHGMGRTARVVGASATAELQASRILKHVGPKGSGVIVHSRDEAWKSLTA